MKYAFLLSVAGLMSSSAFAANLPDSLCGSKMKLAVVTVLKLSSTQTKMELFSDSRNANVAIVHVAETSGSFLYTELDLYLSGFTADGDCVVDQVVNKGGFR